MEHTAVRSTAMDTATITGLRAGLGEDRLGGLLQGFGSGMPDRVAMLRRALEQGRVEALRLEAHSLRGTAASFGAKRLSELCTLLEQGAHSPDAARLVDEVGAEAEAVAAVARIGRSA